MFDTINLYGGKIVHNGFNIDLLIPLEKQIFELNEDLMQIEYGDEYFIDVGWYPSLDPKGFFLIRIIEGGY